MPDDAASRKFRLGDIASRRDPKRGPWGYYCCDYNVFGVGPSLLLVRLLLLIRQVN